MSRFIHFQNGVPGLALVLFRVTLSMMLFSLIANSSLSILGYALLYVALASLSFGLLTRWTGAVCCGGVLIALAMIRGIDVETGCVAAVLCATLAMLGPGAYSLDALRLGRRRRVFPRDD